MMDFFPKQPPTNKTFVDLFPREQRHFRGEKAAGSDFERKDSLRAEWPRLLPWAQLHWRW
jgi:hypothetical protein